MAKLKSEAAGQSVTSSAGMPCKNSNEASGPAVGEVLDTWQLDTAQARALWSDVVHDTYALLPSDAQPGGHRVKARVWMLDDILLSRFEAEANSVIRTPQLARKSPSELVKLKIFQSGHMDIHDDEAFGRLGPDAISFIDHDRPSTQISTRHSQLSVFLPYHAIGFDPSKHPPWFGIGRDSAMGRLIEAGVTSVFDSLDTVAEREASALAAGLAGLIRGAIDGGFGNAEASDFQTARRAAIRKFVEDRLGDPALGGDTVLKSFGLSRTTLYRDFDDYGGIQRYILQRRLHRAFRLLSESQPTRGIVGAVSERLGFGSVHNFSRVFRERFGEPPGAVVGRWANPEPDVASPGAIVQSYPAEFSAVRQKLRWSYGRFSSAG